MALILALLMACPAGAQGGGVRPDPFPPTYSKKFHPVPHISLPRFRPKKQTQYRHMLHPAIAISPCIATRLIRKVPTMPGIFFCDAQCTNQCPADFLVYQPNEKMPFPS